MADEYVTKAIYEHLGLSEVQQQASDVSAVAEMPTWDEYVGVSGPVLSFGPTNPPQKASAKPVLIAFTGYAGSGKSTAADILAFMGFRRLKFADPPKNMLRSIGASERELEGDMKEVPSVLFEGKTPRHAMQTLGTEWGRDLIGPDFWKNAWERHLEGLFELGCSVVNDDCRFTNEAATIRAQGGVIVRLFRNRDGHIDHHPSESGVNALPYDYSINNDGTITSLRLKLEQLVKHLTAPNDDSCSDLPARHGS